MLGKLVVGGLAAFGAFEAWKRYAAPMLGLSKVTMIQGHNYAMVFDYTTDPSAPASPQSLQAAFDLVAPGTFKVLTGSLTPGPAVAARQLAMNVEMMAATQAVPVNVFLDALKTLEIGIVSLDHSADMGVSPTASGTAAAALTS